MSSRATATTTGKAPSSPSGVGGAFSPPAGGGRESRTLAHRAGTEAVRASRVVQKKIEKPMNGPCIRTSNSNFDRPLPVS